MEKICTYFPEPFADTCDSFIATYGAWIIAGFAANDNSDDICNSINICQTPNTDQCRLHPVHGTKSHARTETKSTPNWRELAAKAFPHPPKETPWQWILNLINRLTEKHEPVVDLDRDMFSDAPHFRGSTWRGKDCNDLDAHIRPGRKSNPYRGSGVDHDCNGIYGFAPDGTEWDQKLCKGSHQHGVVVMGDSAGAHFEIPPKYLTAADIGPGNFDDLWAVVTDEIDKPQRSGYTGYEASTTQIPVRSLYLHMRERNLCNHRDFQNIAVNGARSGAIKDLSQALGRNATQDHPLLMVVELIGNDVCDTHPDPSSMTTPAEFYANLMEFLPNLDARVPPGSHLVALGLVKGSLLYQTLGQRIHPIGVTYERVYNLLNCLQINPCYMWLNSNETLRQMGDQRAHELNQVWRQVIKDVQPQLKNIDLQFYGVLISHSLSVFDSQLLLTLSFVHSDFPAQEIMTSWKNQGHDPAELIGMLHTF